MVTAISHGRGISKGFTLLNGTLSWLMLHGPKGNQGLGKGKGKKKEKRDLQGGKQNCINILKLMKAIRGQDLTPHSVDVTSGH
jgi:hypothetical protein